MPVTFPPRAGQGLDEAARHGIRLEIHPNDRGRCGDSHSGSDPMRTSRNQYVGWSDCEVLADSRLAALGSVPLEHDVASFDPTALDQRRDKGVFHRRGRIDAHPESASDGLGDRATRRHERHRGPPHDIPAADHHASGLLRRP